MIFYIVYAIFLLLSIVLQRLLYINKYIYFFILFYLEFDKADKKGGSGKWETCFSLKEKKKKKNGGKHMTPQFTQVFVG